MLTSSKYILFTIFHTAQSFLYILFTGVYINPCFHFTSHYYLVSMVTFKVLFTSSQFTNPSVLS